VTYFIRQLYDFECLQRGQINLRSWT